MTRILKRTELYELVWTQPLIRIAADPGFSDVALLKICRKHSIPTPRAGHWAKAAAGKPVVRKALPKTPAVLELIEIRGSRRRSAVVQEAEDRSRKLQCAEIPNRVSCRRVGILNTALDLTRIGYNRDDFKAAVRLVNEVVAHYGIFAI